MRSFAPTCFKMRSLVGLLIAGLAMDLLTLAGAQDLTPLVAELSKTQIWSLMDKDRGPDIIELAPFTEDGRSITIPDHSQSDLLFRLADNLGLPPYKDDALKLWTSEVPRTSRNQPLYGKSTDGCTPWLMVCSIYEIRRHSRLATYFSEQ